MAINFVTPFDQNVYVIPMDDAFNEFRARHDGFYRPEIAHEQRKLYFESIVENMVAHMEYQNVGLPSYVEYCSQNIIEGVNQGYQYHPYRFIQRPPTEAQWFEYLLVLTGFARHFFATLEELDYYNINGTLMGAYQGVVANNLVLAYRPPISSIIY